MFFCEFHRFKKWIGRPSAVFGFVVTCFLHLQYVITHGDVCTCKYYLCRVRDIDTPEVMMNDSHFRLGRDSVKAGIESVLMCY